MQRLPIGQQNFAEIINNKLLYVDKTEYIYRLLQNKYYFLSRPRRFGKSLLISTLKELFLGNNDLFKNLWIYDKIEWSKHPVIHISFNTLDYEEKGLRIVLENKLDEIANDYGITLKNTGYSDKFKELIQTLGTDVKVVILIDEYDKSIIDYVDNLEQAKENRNILKNFYSIIKDSDAYIRFLFITGVSKFSQVSIFSDLNNLTDITIGGDYARLLGITPDEVSRYFGEHLQALQDKYSEQIPDITTFMEAEYLGYSWDGKHRVYNPFLLLNVFSRQEFGDYWFRTGTPTFLMKLIRDKNYTALDIQNNTFSVSILDKYEIENMTLMSLLFQTGYLTIKELDPIDQFVTLDYPNKEVARAFSLHLLANMNGGEIEKAGGILNQMVRALRKDDLSLFLDLFKTLLKGISYPIVPAQENYFHSIFYLVVRMLGFYIESEVLTINGRIDAVIKTAKTIYIMEFKTGNTIKAIEQIKQKGYHLKYADDQRPKILVGLDFDTQTKELKGYDIQEEK